MYYFCTMTKISETIKLHLRKDKVLKKIIDSIELPVRGKKANVYDSLIGSIVSQQLSVKAASTIHSRFLDLYGGITPSPDQILTTDHETMRGVGLSNQKAGYMKNLAEYFLSKPIENKHWMSLSDEDIIKELSSIKGIGVWTVQMMLMFNLGRPDVLPTDDLIIRQFIIKYYKIEASSKKEELEKIHKVASKWSPYRSHACLYLWASKDFVF
jgi:DNA-3-methyladenine glycosylase II